MPMPILPGLLLALWLADPFSYSFNNLTSEKGEAELVLTANENVGAFEVTIKGDKQVIKKSVNGLKSGQTYKVKWVQNGQQAAYSMEIAGALQGSGNFEMMRPAAGGKATAAGGKIEPLFNIDDIRERRVAYRVPYEVETYTFTVYDSDGNVMFEDTGRDPGKAGQRIELRWNGDAEVFMIKFAVVGRQGQTAEDIRVPWSVDIPHTDVVFHSGKADIRKDQEGSVDDAAIVAMHELAGLEKANKAVGANLTAQLYIIGYTDTVGGAADNKKLSEARAKSIAEYFRKKGVWCEIYYAGMGEQGLKVQTADNVDEERNRRASYILSPQRPPAGGPIPGNWKKAADARMRPAGELPPYPEKYREAREKQKYGSGGGGGGSSSGGSSSSDGGGSGGGSGSGPTEPSDEDAYGSSYSGGSESYDSAPSEGPGEVEGKPGASSKGCAVASDYRGALAVGLWAGLWGFARRRRQA